jgi:hypothetical protein
MPPETEQRRNMTKAILLVAGLVLAAIVGIKWYLLHRRAGRRWRALLDRYADLEEAKRNHP